MQEHQPQQHNQQFIHQMLEFGFSEQYIQIAMKYTHDKEKAAEIIMKLMDEGPNADLSTYFGKPIPEKIQKKNNRVKMMFIVNGQLKMGKGKVCAQVAHAVIGTYLQFQQQARFNQKIKSTLDAWEYTGGAKIVIKADTLKQILQIKQKLDTAKINNYLVEDHGHTQVKAGSKTILGIGPVYSQQIDQYTQHLKLL